MITNLQTMNEIIEFYRGKKNDGVRDTISQMKKINIEQLEGLREGKE